MKKTYEYYKNYPRDKFEMWLNLHNHELEFLRSLMNVVGVTLQIVILLKIFGKI